MQNKVIINRGDADIRVAFLEDNQLVEFHQETFDQKSLVGNIYRGVIQDVIPGLQAAFVDIGLERNAFLHFLDVRSESLVMTEPNLEEALQRAAETVIPGRIVKKGRRDRIDLKAGVTEAPIAKGDTIIVQVVKDGIGDKAPRVSTNLALAGRYVVLLPFPGQSGGVSRKVAMGKERFALKKILNKLRSKSQSFIMRTAGLGADEEHIHADVERLQNVWDEITTSFRSTRKPKLVYSDHNIVDRMVRDVFSADIDGIILDDATLANELRESLNLYMPELANAIELYTGIEPIFEAFAVERQLELAMDNKFWLKSGGYLIIEETEALTAIDVNTGRFTGSKDQERTSFKINMEACEAIADQIRLRDIGGIIVIDFIDMLNTGNKRKVTEEFHACMEQDRSKSQIGQVGEFGLLMLTRKRKNKSLKKQIFETCPYCDGKAHVLRKEEIWRRIKSDLLLMCEDADKLSAIVVTCEPAMAEFLETTFKSFVRKLAQSNKLEIIIRPETTLHREDFTLTGIERPGRDALSIPGFRIDSRRKFQESLPYDSISTQEIVAALVDEDLEEDVEQEAPQQQDSEEESSNGKRTRRGRRGGRRRQSVEEESDDALFDKAAARDFEADDREGLEVDDDGVSAHAPLVNAFLNEDDSEDDEAEAPVAKQSPWAKGRKDERKDSPRHEQNRGGRDQRSGNRGAESAAPATSSVYKKPAPAAVAATPSAGALVEVAEGADYQLKSKLQIVSRQVLTAPKDAAGGDERAKAIAIAVKLPETRNIENLRSVKILSTFDNRLSKGQPNIHTPEPVAEVAAPVAAPVPVAASTTPFKPSRNLQVVARWGAKKETPVQTPAPAQPVIPVISPSAVDNSPLTEVAPVEKPTKQKKSSRTNVPATVVEEDELPVQSSTAGKGRGKKSMTKLTDETITPVVLADIETEKIAVKKAAPKKAPAKKTTPKTEETTGVEAAPSEKKPAKKSPKKST